MAFEHSAVDAASMARKTMVAVVVIRTAYLCGFDVFISRSGKFAPTMHARNERISVEGFNENKMAARANGPKVSVAMRQCPRKSMLHRLGVEGDLLPSLSKGLPPEAIRGGWGACRMNLHSPSGWVTAAPDRRVYPRPRFRFILSSEYKKLTASNLP